MNNHIDPPIPLVALNLPECPERICAWCGKEYVVHLSHALYAELFCSPRCEKALARHVLEFHAVKE